MNAKFLPVVALSLMVATGCNNQSTKQTNNVEPVTLNMANMDTTVAPGESFYQYATGGWQKANPIPDEYARYGAFDKLREENQKQLQTLIEELSTQQHAAGTNAQKVGDLYAMGMDSVKLNADGAAPLKPLMDKVAALSNKNDVPRMIASLSKVVANPFWGFYVGADDMNSSMNIGHLSQSGLSMGDRDYYILTDDHTKEIREAYTKLIQTQFVNAGFDVEQANLAATNVMRIETALAKAHFTKEKRRLPEANYHKLAVKDLNQKVAAFDWTAYFDEMDASAMDSLNVSQIEPIQVAVGLINTESLESLQDYFRWKVIASASPYLSDAFVNARFDFYGKTMTGAKENRPRWRRSIDVVNGTLGEALGQLYVEKYFPAAAKERMVELVHNLTVAYGERIDALDWMDDATKQKAHEKLSTFIVKVGYPDKWRDYAPLSINDDSYWQNMVRASEFEYQDMIKDLGKPVDKTKWYMSPQTVNAYYSPSSNEICFPAGILQPPFFYIDGDDAINYGGIGVVIGHEMTHGFDDQGRKFDKDGNLADWWTADDATRFDERAKVLVDFFDNIIVLGDVHANGTFTLGENLADHGGLQISYQAFSKTQQAKDGQPIDGFTPNQRFFLNYANLWAGNVRDAEILRLTKTDPHTLGKWRVDGALPHIDAWYEAFNITETDKMFVPKEKRASIW